MNREEQWLLPDGVEEILPARAAQIEALRRRLLDQFSSWGYELIFPPLIEFLDSLLTGGGRDLERETFKLTDQLSGRLLGVRADITPQVARLDAHSLRRHGPTRLCYCSTALRTRAPQPGGSRIPYQIGVELFGHAGMESDAEVLSLMMETLTAAEMTGVTLDLGHVGIYRALVKAGGLSAADEATLSGIYLRKGRQELEQQLATLSLTPAQRDALAALPWLAGGVEVLSKARNVLASMDEDVVVEVNGWLDELEVLATFIQSQYPSVTLHIDLGELRGYHYHTGCLFAAYTDDNSEPVAKGGRYDHIGEVFGRARPATGFSADLKLLAAQQPAVPSADSAGVLAIGDIKDATFLARVKALREQGERVLLSLPGADNNSQELQCSRQLVFQDGRWQLTSL